MMLSVVECEKQNETLKKERDSWEETALVLGNNDAVKSIQISMKQIAEGRGIPLAKL